jgi:hypothetical protein
MKKVNLEITLEFNEKIANDEQLKEVIENVLSAIEKKTETSNIAPWESDNYTKSVTITEPLSRQTVTKELI